MEDKNLREDQSQKKFLRWDIHQRIQHILLFTTFIILSVTGLAIKFPHIGYARFCTSVFGGFDTLFMWHVAAGWTMVGTCLYHVVWMIVRSLQGKLGIAIAPSLKDITDVVDTLRFNMGLSDKKPHYDRYSYKEKFDYWAVFWGMFVIGGSGVLMTFPEWGVHIFPRWILDMWQVGHSDEAVLAITFIFGIHFYNVHFSPDFFPGSMHWLTGWMSREVMAHEHPAELERRIKEGLNPEELDGLLPDLGDSQAVYVKE